MFRFANPWWLTVLLFLPPLAWWLWRKQCVTTLRYSAVELAADLPRTLRQRLHRLPLVLRFLVLPLLILGLARPQMGQQQEVIRGDGVDIVLALDISGSMAALDFPPENRVEAAKAVIGNFIGTRRYDRIGLVVFARNAFSQSPPTFDYRTLRTLLAGILPAPELGLEDGTALGLGLAQAATMLQDSTAESRVIILLTDGVHNAGQIDPLTAAQTAKALDIRVYTIGMGRPGQVQMPVDDPLLGRTIRWVESELDEETLRAVAESTGGLYFRATDGAGLAEIYNQIGQLETSEIEIEVFTTFTELVWWVLIPASILLLLEFLLRHTWLRTFT